MTVDSKRPKEAPGAVPNGGPFDQPVDPGRMDQRGVYWSGRDISTALICAHRQAEAEGLIQAGESQLDLIGSGAGAACSVMRRWRVPLDEDQIKLVMDNLIRRVLDLQARSLEQKRKAHAGLLWAMQHGTKSGRPVGRPRVRFDFTQAYALRKKGLSWSRLAEATGVKVATLRRRIGALEWARGRRAR